MNMIDYLTKYHRVMEVRLGTLIEATDPERARLFGPMADLLVAHVSIEEEHVYPEVKARWSEEMLLESLEEHLSMKRLLADLLVLSPEDKHFEPKLYVLKEQVEHHHKEEEEHLFPRVRKLFNGERLETLGRELEAANEALMRSRPRERVLSQTKAATKLP
jgi:hemerythrin superfamily protein